MKQVSQKMQLRLRHRQAEREGKRMSKVKRKAAIWILTAVIGAVVSVKAYRQFEAYQEFSSNLDAMAAYCETHACHAPYN